MQWGERGSINRSFGRSNMYKYTFSGVSFVTQSGADSRAVVKVRPTLLIYTIAAHLLFKTFTRSQLPLLMHCFTSMNQIKILSLLCLGLHLRKCSFHRLWIPCAECIIISDASRIIVLYSICFQRRRNYTPRMLKLEQRKV